MRIERYTETYLDDAMRLCQYIAREDGVITIVKVGSADFPGLPKGLEIPETVSAVRVTRDGVTKGFSAVRKVLPY